MSCRWHAQKCWSVCQVVLLLLSTQSERAVWICVIWSCSPSLRAQKTSVCMARPFACTHNMVAEPWLFLHGRLERWTSLSHGNLVERWEFQGNTGDKRVKRKRGSRSAAAVAVRIERGYLIRTRIAGRIACLNNHVDCRGTGTYGSGHLAAERTSTTARDGDGDTRTRKRKAAQQEQSMSNTPRQRVQAVVDTRVIGKQDHFDVDPMKYADWSFKLRSYLGAVDQRYQEELTKTEAANLGSEESALSTQMYYILVMTTSGAALDKCHNAAVNEGFEAWRQFVMEWELKLRTRYVGLQMNVLEYRFGDDITTKLAAFERTVHDYENQSTRTVDDDIKIGVTMLGMEDMRVEEHFIQNSVRITSWNQMREEILEITRTQQYIDSRPIMQLGANPSKGKGKDSKGKGKGKSKDVKGKDEAKDVKNESFKKAKSDDQRKCFYCQKTGRMQKATEKSCRCRGETVGSVPNINSHISHFGLAAITAWKVKQWMTRITKDWPAQRWSRDGYGLLLGEGDGSSACEGSIGGSDVGGWLTARVQNVRGWWQGCQSCMRLT